MGNYAYLDSFEHIDRILSARAHQVEAKHYIPIYWLAMYEPTDIRTEPLSGVRYAKDPDKHFVVQPPYLISDATSAMARLKRRTPALATLGGEAHRKMLTEFGAFARRLKPSIMVRLDDLVAGKPKEYLESLRGTLELCKKLDDATVHPDSYLIEPLTKIWADAEWKTSDHAEHLLGGWGWRVSPEERVKNSQARKWNKLVGDAESATLQAYTVKKSFVEEELFTHPTLGAGVVMRVVDANKIEVLFREGLRTLVHGRT